MSLLVSFLRFWYDFIVGDDWLIALAVAGGLLVTWLITRAHDVAWWLLPIVVVVILGVSLWRAGAPARHRNQVSHGQPYEENRATS